MLLLSRTTIGIISYAINFARTRYKFIAVASASANEIITFAANLTKLVPN